MRKSDSVLCAACGSEFEVGLIELVRMRRPAWCSQCIADADRKLRQAAHRAAMTEPIPDHQPE